MADTTTYVANAGPVYHATAACFNCPWEDGDYRTARAAAAEHVEASGHKVEVSIGYSLTRITEAEMLAKAGVR